MEYGPITWLGPLGLPVINPLVSAPEPERGHGYAMIRDHDTMEILVLAPLLKQNPILVKGTFQMKMITTVITAKQKENQNCF